MVRERWLVRVVVYVAESSCFELRIVVPCHLILSVIAYIDGYEFKYFKSIIRIIDITN